MSRHSKTVDGEHKSKKFREGEKSDGKRGEMRKGRDRQTDTDTAGVRRRQTDRPTEGKCLRERWKEFEGIGRKSR